MMSVNRSDLEKYSKRQLELSEQLLNSGEVALKKAIESLEKFNPEDLSPAVVARLFTAISQLINTGSEAAARALALDELLERVGKTLNHK